MPKKIILIATPIVFLVFETIILSYLNIITGSLASVTIIISTSIIGLYILIRNFREKSHVIQINSKNINSPIQEVIKKITFTFIGVFLLIPGIVTDIIGLMLLIPKIRRILAQKLILLGSNYLLSALNKKNPPAPFRSEETNTSEEIEDGKFNEINKKN